MEVNKIIEFALMSGNSYKESRDDVNMIPIPEGWSIME
jgi:hypothetical protein